MPHSRDQNDVGNNPEQTLQSFLFAARQATASLRSARKRDAEASGWTCSAMYKPLDKVED